MADKYPLIYIAALIRTGSTVLSESLTKLPYAFIFREPHFGKNYFRLKPDDPPSFSTEQTTLESFPRFRLPIAFLLRRLRPLGFPQDFMVRQLKNYLIPQLQVKQIGVKEIKHQGWRNYHKHFPNMRVILTGRDPRDIYVSLYNRLKKGSIAWQSPFTPETVAQELLTQFDYQQRMMASCNFMRLRYEELCTDPNKYVQVKTFVQSPIPNIGNIGTFNKEHQRRQDEYRLHGKNITAKQIGRWKREPDKELVANAQQLFDLMPEYTEFWGYKR